MELPTEEGHLRDWEDLAELVSISNEPKAALLQYNNNPTLEILNLYSEKNSKSYTLEKLLWCLKKWTGLTLLMKSQTSFKRIFSNSRRPCRSCRVGMWVY